MAEDVGSVVDSKNGSFQNQITHRLPRKASQAGMGVIFVVCVGLQNHHPNTAMPHCECKCPQALCNAW